MKRNFSVFQVSADIQVVLCDLVGVHAGSWDLDRSLPVEVVVAQVKGELLNGLLGNWRVIVSDEEVSGKDTALVGILRDEVEVVL